MRLFVYGTLLDPAVLARRGGAPLRPTRARGATLRGWRRVRLIGSHYPTLRRDRGGVVPGLVVDVGASVPRRLNA